MDFLVLGKMGQSGVSTEGPARAFTIATLLPLPSPTSLTALSWVTASPGYPWLRLMKGAC